MRDAQTAVALARLRQDCVLAKEALSLDTEAIIPVFLPGRHLEVRLTRADFEDMVRAAIESTIGALSRTVQSAGLTTVGPQFGAPGGRVITHPADRGDGVPGVRPPGRGGHPPEVRGGPRCRTDRGRIRARASGGARRVRRLRLVHAGGRGPRRTGPRRCRHVRRCIRLGSRHSRAGTSAGRCSRRSGSRRHSGFPHASDSGPASASRNGANGPPGRNLRRRAERVAGPSRQVLGAPPGPCQYTSKEFADFCAGSGVVRSMGRRATCYDNAVSESFFATYKKELIHTRPWNGLAEVRQHTFLWIESYYNRRRRHSTLAYLTPTEYDLGFRTLTDLAA